MNTVPFRRVLMGIFMLTMVAVLLMGDTRHPLHAASLVNTHRARASQTALLSQVTCIVGDWQQPEALVFNTLVASSAKAAEPFIRQKLEQGSSVVVFFSAAEYAGDFWVYTDEDTRQFPIPFDAGADGRLSDSVSAVSALYFPSSQAVSIELYAYPGFEGPNASMCGFAAINQLSDLFSEVTDLTIETSGSFRFGSSDYVAIDAVNQDAATPNQAEAPDLTGGRVIQPGELDAVGQLNGGACTATLFTQRHVLTAAHCVCNSAGCATRASFTLSNVFPVDDPVTAEDESRTRRDITIRGAVRVHPEYEQRGWLSEDLAVVTLDRPANEMAKGVAPIAVEQPHNTPLVGVPLTLVGYGTSGANCSMPVGTKLALTLKPTRSDDRSIHFEYDGQGVCPGDSGGPVLNTAGKIVGVASWRNTVGDLVKSSTYRPTSYSYNWIYNLVQQPWKSRSWVLVEKAGINSHAPNVWCPNGSFLVSFDLDGKRNLSPYDSPVVGQAQCATPDLGDTPTWGTCSWIKVEQDGKNSHSPNQAWCPVGAFLTGIDLDGPRNYDEKDAPVVGQARCCTLSGTEQKLWGSTYWTRVGAIASHNPGDPWCLAGAFMTQFDLDRRDPDVSPDGYDAPIVGQAKCSRPYPSTTPGSVSVTAQYDRIELSWGEVSGATGYSVYRTPVTTPGARSSIGSTKVPSYVDRTAEPLVSYTYQVQSFGEERPPSELSTPVTARLHSYMVYLPHVAVKR